MKPKISRRVERISRKLLAREPVTSRERRTWRKAIGMVEGLEWRLLGRQRLDRIPRDGINSAVLRARREGRHLMNLLEKHGQG